MSIHHIIQAIVTAHEPKNGTQTEKSILIMVANPVRKVFKNKDRVRYRITVFQVSGYALY